MCLLYRWFFLSFSVGVNVLCFNEMNFVFALLFFLVSLLIFCVCNEMDLTFVFALSLVTVQLATERLDSLQMPSRHQVMFYFLPKSSFLPSFFMDKPIKKILKYPKDLFDQSSFHCYSNSVLATPVLSPCLAGG